MYEYLKILQTHLETMHGMMGTMQGAPHGYHLKSRPLNMFKSM